MEKLKSFSLTKILAIIKCCLVGLVATLLGVVLFAVVLKFMDLPSSIIGYVNNIIKVLSIFVMVLCVKRSVEGNMLINAGIGGAIYALLSFVVFSIFNGSFSFNASFLFDLLFAVIVAVICAVIINLLKRKN